MPRSRSETSRSPRRCVDGRRGRRRRATRSRGGVSGRSATNSSASSAASVSSIGGGRSAGGAGRVLGDASPSPGSRRVRDALLEVELVGHANDSSDSSSGVRASDPAAAAPPVVARATIGPHGSACSTTISRRFMSSSMRQERDRDDDPVADAGEQVLEDDRRRVAQGRPDDRGALGERDRARHDLGRRLGRRRDQRRDATSAPASDAGSSGGASAGRAPARPAARAAPGSRRNSADPLERALGQAQRRRRGRRGRGAGARAARPRGRRLVAVEGRGSVGRAARQHRPALDEDELDGDRDERADVAEPVRLETGERVEVGVGEAAERHGQDVELARLDERQEQGQRPVELGDLDLGRGSRAGGRHRSGRPSRGRVADRRRHDRAMPGHAAVTISWPRRRAGAARRRRGRAGRPGGGSARRSVASSRPPPPARRRSRRGRAAAPSDWPDSRGRSPATRQIHAP